MTLARIGFGVARILPQILFALIIVLIGVIVGTGIGRLIEKAIGALPLDKALAQSGVTDIFRRTGYTLNLGKLLGKLVSGFIMLVFVLAALDALQLTQVNLFLREVVLSYLPHVIVAVLILIAAALIAEVAHNIVVGTSRAADVSSHYLLGTIARIAIWTFAILASLHELRVAPEFIETLFTGVVVAISIALGLSFGLGGREAAGRYIDHVVDEVRGKKGR